MSKLTSTVEVQLWTGTAYSTTWTDITADVLMPGLHCSSGTPGTTIKDRVSDVGTCTFDLDNSIANSAQTSGYYTPTHIHARGGFDIGCPIRVRFTFEGLTRTKWYGRIYGIHPEPGTMQSRVTHITAYDWMYQANKYTLSLPSYETEKRMDDALPMVVAGVPIQPQARDFQLCESTFPVIFDNLDYRTTAMAEFQKLALSEIGNIYLAHNLSGDEILSATGKDARWNIPLSSYNLKTIDCGKMLNENNTALLNEDGTYLLLDQTADAVFTDSQVELGYSYGDQISNHVAVTTYPRNVNNTVDVLFSMTEPVMIAAGETVDWYQVIYKDPNGRAYSVCGKDIVPVVPTTDYLFSTGIDGSGDITTDLEITGIYGVNNTEFTFTNHNASDGYITFLQIRGKAILLFDKVTRIAEDQDSIDQYGLSEFTYDMPYQPPPFTAQTIADVMLSNYKDPKAIANSITFYTRDDDSVNKFLAIDCNRKITVTETQTAINNDFYIQGWEFEITGNNEVTGLIIKSTDYLFMQELHSYNI